MINLHWRQTTLQIYVISIPRQQYNLSIQILVSQKGRDQLQPMHHTAASYAPRLLKLAAKKQQISIEKNGVALQEHKCK
jgi:hypothetical protein